MDSLLVGGAEPYPMRLIREMPSFSLKADFWLLAAIGIALTIYALLYPVKLRKLLFSCMRSSWRQVPGAATSLTDLLILPAVSRDSFFFSS